MAAIFESYEQQFSSLTAEITRRLGSVSSLYGVDKKTVISSIERQLDEAQELLEQMDLEVRDMPSAERGKLMSRVKSYQTEYTNLESQLKKHKTSAKDAAKMREELLEYDDGSTNDQRTRLLDNTERLERSTRRLEAGYRIAVETEKIGQDVIDNLHRDRETIGRTRTRLREGDDHLGKSSRILNSMTRRIIQNRLITFGVVIFMLIVIIVVIYFVATKHK
ncbi:vesicle transport through interaction with t-SNAREs homolog 1A-like [Styela clava]|uniref:vesicle transport through interaction with t-SNAREs homolog 1A-like n=1 Tax=Styela clava TaxID=7725 RepID=UPI00193AC387|nr:vesicle transport through interaction with t-SNAREs homolog 1A-like [Styela clava]